MSINEPKKLKKFDYINSYYSDIVLPDMLFAILIRSPIQAGFLQAILAPDLPENYFLLTAKNIPKKNEVSTADIVCPVFADEQIDYKGQVLGILVGSDKAYLYELAERIEIRTKETPPLQFSKSFSDEQILYSKSIVHGEVDATFAQAEHSFENKFSFSLPTTYEETNGVLAHFENDILHIYTPTHWESQVREAISTATGIAENKIFIHKTLTEKCSANYIWLNTVTAVQCAVAALQIKKPVMLVYSREEQRTYIEQDVSATIRHRTAINQNFICAMDIQILVDAGFLNLFIQTIIDKLMITSIGLYGAKTLRVEAFAIKTNKPPLAASINWGDAQAFFAVENQLDHIIKSLKLDPFDFRQKNFLGNPDTALDFHPAYCTKNLAPIIQAVKKNSDFDRKHTIYSILSGNKNNRQSMPARGIGLAVGFEGNVFFDNKMTHRKHSLEVTMEKDGFLTIHTAPVSHSIHEIWTNLAANALSIDPAYVQFKTEYAHEDSREPDTISNNISIMTQLLAKCCEAIQKQRFREPLPITIKKTSTLSNKNLWDSETFTGRPFYSTSLGAAVMEIELNSLLFTTNIRSLWLCLDIGAVIHKKQALHAIKRAIDQTLANLIFGTPLYSPKVDIVFLESTEEPKDIGDIVQAIVPSAFSIAVSQAVNQTIHKLPLSQDGIYLMEEHLKNK